MNPSDSTRWSIRCGASRSLSRRAPALMACLAPLLFSMMFAGCASTGKQADANNIGEGLLSARGLQRQLGPMDGQDEFETAKALFDEAAAIQQTAKELEKLDKSKAAAERSRGLVKCDAAAAEFKRLRKKYRDKPIEEDIMFYQGECLYEQGHYPAAQDMYAELLDKYTSTRYVEPITRRLFYIAQVWLRSPRPADQVERAEFTGEAAEKPVQKDPTVPYVATLLPNFTDRTRPLFDPEGRALEALKSIWLKDPTGPLADDALLVSATYHLRRRNFKEADYFFDTLRTNYPQSEHAQNSYMLGSHVKLLTYQGPSYDGKQLDEAGKLIDSTIRLYPDLPERDRLQQKLDKTRDAAAARDWDRVNFYLRKRAPDAAALYCEFLLRDHPDSEYAPRAVEMLKRLRQPRTANKSAATTDELVPVDQVPLDEIPLDVDEEPLDAADAATGHADVSAMEDDAPAGEDP